MKSPRVLCLLVDGFEEIETVAPVDLLRRAGAEVTLAALGDSRWARGRCGVRIEADALLAELDSSAFEVLLIPGGPGVRSLRSDGRPAALVREFAGRGLLVAAICAAPTVLADAGVLNGRRFTAHASVHGELPGVLASERVVEDGNVVTSRGAGTAVDFGLALVRRLFGEGKASEIAAAIMV